MADNGKTAWVPSVIDDRVLKLTGNAPLQEGAFPPDLQIKWIAKTNAFSVKVNLGMKTDKNYPIVIETAIGLMAFLELCELLDLVAKASGPISFEMDNWGKPFIWDKSQGKSIRSPDVLNVSRFQVAKREDGMVVLSVAAKGKKDVEFEFKGNEWHRVGRNGQSDIGIASRVAVTAWSKFWFNFASDKFKEDWAEPEYEKQRRIERMQNATGGNGQRQSYGGGGGGQQRQNSAPQQNHQQHSQQQASAPSGPSDSFDDDIPF